MAEEKRKFALDLRLPRRNYVGVFFSLVGFILTLLCVVGCRTTHGEKLYFAKISESPAGNLTLYIGWQGYCVQDGQSISCHDDDGVMMMPFDVTIANKFNDTYPQLFADPIQQDPNLNPLSQPYPAHNPKIFAASVLCLLCGGAAWLVGFVWTLCYPRFQDKHYTRGFLAWGASVLSLLLLVLSVVMYQNGVMELNVTYPNLEASEGPGITLMGIAFMVFTISSYSYLHGCWSKNDEEAAYSEGYSPL